MSLRRLPRKRRNNMFKFVSVVIPVYNEEKYIAECIESLLKQTYPKKSTEIIFVDGNSQDNTAEIIKKYSEDYEYIRIMYNEKKIVPISMNVGIRASKGEYIIRLDAHAEYPDNYIEKCVHYLDTTDADNVGGCAITKGRGFTGDAIAAMLSSKFGVGNSRFRTERVSAYVDTVPFGAFRREVFQKVGMYDERLVRNQDNELNFRIIKNGGKIFLAQDIVFSYYCRDSIKGIAKMARQNGVWNIVTSKLCPGTMGLRHFIPFLFVLSLIFLIPLSFVHKVFLLLLTAELILYFALAFLFTVRLKKGFIKSLLIYVLFPMFHISYGIGSVIGIYKALTFDRSGR